MEHPNIRGLSQWQPRARGGFTVVWEARQELFSRRVAVKVYQFGPAEAIYESFAREAAVVGQFSDHPGVVTAYDAGLLTDGRPYVVLELCAGGSLTQWLDPEHRRPEEQVCRTGVQVADALAAVHEQGFLHRDVKPANILIDSLGRPRLADFGLASPIGADAVATDLQRMTPAYAPPEAFARSASTTAGDVYSLAATLFALLSGHPPRRAAADDRREPSESAADSLTRLGVNWYLADIVMSALADDPSARPSAAEFRDRLAEVAAGRGRPPRSRFATIARLAAPKGERRVLSASAVRRDEVEVGSSPRASGRIPESPSRRGRTRIGVLAVALVSVIVAATGTASLLSQPASSSAPAATLQSAPGADATDATKLPDGPTGPAPTPTSTPTTEDAGDGDSVAQVTGANGPIKVIAPLEAAKPFETVRIQGSYLGGADTFLEVQRWVDGTWQTFPVPGKSDKAGKFTVFVELGQPDRYRLRVQDPRSGVKSEPFLLVVKA